MARTITEVRDRALFILGKLARGQTATGELADDMDRAYDQIYQSLETQNLVSWGSTDDIPDEFVEDIALLIAFERSESIPTERFQRIGVRVQGSLERIAAKINKSYQSPFTSEDY